MKYLKYINNEFVPCDESELVNGDKYKLITDSGAIVISFYTVKKAPAELTPIIITGVQGAFMNNSAFTDITCYELTDIIVSGTLAAPDQVFRMPIKRNDGKETIFIVQLIDGKFDAVLNFPTSGEYTYTNEQANSKFPEPLFNVNPIIITVARKTGG